MKTILKIISLIFILSQSTIAFAINLKVTGPCSDKPIFLGNISTNLKKSVGEITIDAFNENQIPYVGNESGMNSIYNTATGLEAIEVISDTKMRAYGWCYSINEIIPDVLPSEIKFSDESDSLHWFYAFSTYDSGNWIDYCVPSYTIHAAQFCSK